MTSVDFVEWFVKWNIFWILSGSKSNDWYLRRPVFKLSTILRGFSFFQSHYKFYPETTQINTYIGFSISAVNYRIKFKCCFKIVPNKDAVQYTLEPWWRTYGLHMLLSTTCNKYGHNKVLGIVFKQHLKNYKCPTQSVEKTIFPSSTFHTYSNYLDQVQIHQAFKRPGTLAGTI